MAGPRAFTRNARECQAATATREEGWSGREDLNLRPPGPQPGALPDCATPRRTATIAQPARQDKCAAGRGASPARRAPLDDERRPPQRGSADSRCYLTSALAPACSSFSLAAFASSLFTPSLTALGAASTRSLASLSPRLVSSRTALITWILFGPISVSMTLNS